MQEIFEETELYTRIKDREVCPLLERIEKELAIIPPDSSKVHRIAGIRHGFLEII